MEVYGDYFAIVPLPHEEDWWNRHLFSMQDKWFIDNAYLWIRMYEFVRTHFRMAGWGPQPFAMQLVAACRNVAVFDFTLGIYAIHPIPADFSRWEVSVPKGTHLLNTLYWYHIQLTLHDDRILELLKRLCEGHDEINVVALAITVTHEFEELIHEAPFPAVGSTWPFSKRA